MIYVDSSVALAKLLAEQRQPPDSFWDHDLASSRLLEYEVWTRVHARQLAYALGDQTDTLLKRIQFSELTPTVLARALAAFPVAVRTLDSLHLATVEYLRGFGQDVALASFDERMLAAAHALHLPIYEF